MDERSDRLMFRLAYRKFGDYESLVANPCQGIVTEDEAIHPALTICGTLMQRVALRHQRLS